MVLLLYHVDTGQSTPRGGVSFVKGMTQAELAEKINVTQSILCQIERGTKAPSWPLGTEIAAFIGGALAKETDSFKKRFISMLARLKESDWEVLERMVAGIKKD